MVNRLQIAGTSLPARYPANGQTVERSEKAQPVRTAPDYAHDALRRTNAVEELGTVCCLRVVELVLAGRKFHRNAEHRPVG